MTTHDTPHAMRALRERLRSVHPEEVDRVFPWIDLSLLVTGLRSYDVAEVLFGDALRRGAQEWSDRFLSVALELARSERTIEANLRDGLAVSRWIDEAFALTGRAVSEWPMSTSSLHKDLKSLLAAEDPNTQGEGPDLDPPMLATSGEALDEAEKSRLLRGVAILAKAKYRVGRAATIDPQERRRVLSRIITEPFPKEWMILGQSSLHAWDTPGSSTRVQRLVQTLDRLRRFAAASDETETLPHRRTTIAHCTADLAWLKSKLGPLDHHLEWPPV